MEFDRSRCLPIAEDFHSLQGEGRFVGTPMHFIRLAGCSVGDPPSTGDPANPFPILKTGEQAWKCHTYDGRAFFCDTDFKFNHWGNFAQLLDDTWEEHICLTGGEPLIHMEKLEQFIVEAQQRDIQIHIETSGTILWDMPNVWISVSPKLDVLDAMINTADEIKILIDEAFDPATLSAEVLHHPLVYVQPINDEMMVRRDNFERCMKLLRMYPGWHLSSQSHKFWGLR